MEILFAIISTLALQIGLCIFAFMKKAGRVQLAL